MNLLTGANIWQITNSPNYIKNFTVRKDTIYCSYYESNVPANPQGINNIAALNKQTGSLLWKKLIPELSGPDNIKLHGNILNYISTPSNCNTVSQVYSFDIDTKTVLWSTPVGINDSNAYSKMKVNYDVLWIKNGSGTLLGLTKNTGETI